MTQSNIQKIINDFITSNNINSSQRKMLGYGITLGVVIDTDDPLQQGRLQIFCPSLNDNPKKIHHIPWAAYASPFSGVINNPSFTRGVGDGPETSDGAVHYGFWAIPEQGAHVLVCCIDGDIRRRIWVGCVPEQQETHTMPHGRYSWGDSAKPDGPLTSNKSPIEPLYTNQSLAFNSDRTSREWKTRGADYQATAVDEYVGQSPNQNKEKYIDDLYETISKNEQDDWVKPILGANGYDWSSIKSVGAFLSSKVYSITTPGFHAFSMDDRAYNSRIRFRTATGHQILLDDTNERIYISTNKGNNYIELDSSGNIDIFSNKRVSVFSEQDINLSSNKTIRMWGKEGIHMYSGENMEQTILDSKPSNGEIRIQAQNDLTLISENNFRFLSTNDALFEFGGKNCVSVGDSLYLQVQNEINVSTNTGDFNLSVSGSLNEIVQGDVNKLALGTMKNMSSGDAQMHSFGGKMDVGAQYSINMKSISEDITIHAVGKNEENTGGCFIKTPESQMGLSDKGHFVSTNKKIKMKSKEEFEAEMGENVETPQNPPIPSTDVGECDIGDTVSTDGFTGIDLVARVAYNAGFRGDALTTAVAIAGGESSYNPDAVGDITLQTEKWGPSVGIFQIRTLNNPEEWTGVDAQRDINSIGGAANIQNNANLAYSLSKNGTDFSPWSAFTSGAYQDYINDAENAVSIMCGDTLLGVAVSGKREFDLVFGSSGGGCGISLSDLCIPSLLTSSENLFRMTEEGMELQSKIDTKLKSIQKGFSSKLYDETSGILPKIQDLVHSQLKLTLDLSGIFGAIGGLAPGIGAIGDIISAASSFVADITAITNILSNPISLLPTPSITIGPLLDLDIDLPSHSVCSMELPYFDADINMTFNYDFNFELCGKTIL